MWPLKWVFIVVMVFVARTQFLFRNSPSVDEWAVVPLLTSISIAVLIRDVVLLLRRRDDTPRARGLRIASITFLTAIAIINTWTMLAAPSADDEPELDVEDRTTMILIGTRSCAV
jgi:hypothetical protein